MRFVIANNILLLFPVFRKPKLEIILDKFSLQGGEAADDIVVPVGSG